MKDKLYDFYDSPSRRSPSRRERVSGIERRVKGKLYWIAVSAGMKPIVEDIVQDLSIVEKNCSLSETTLHLTKMSEL